VDRIISSNVIACEAI